MHASVSIKTIRLKSERSLKAQIPSWKKKKKKDTSASKSPCLAQVPKGFISAAERRYPKARHTGTESLVKAHPTANPVDIALAVSALLGVPGDRAHPPRGVYQTLAINVQSSSIKLLFSQWRAFPWWISSSKTPPNYFLRATSTWAQDFYNTGSLPASSSQANPALHT